MAHTRIARPKEGEYAQYFHRYITRVPDGDLIEILNDQAAATRGMLRSLSDTEAAFRYEPGKWSIKQVVGHLTDTERIMAYRALCFARGEQAVLPSFEEDDYVKAARFDERDLSDLLAELGLVRASTVAFFDGLNEEELMRRGRTASGEHTVRAMAYNIAGHELHHQQILNDRYLTALRAGTVAGAR
jgi:uncharacterized damage-inducible protein DinB